MNEHEIACTDSEHGTSPQPFGLQFLEAVPDGEERMGGAGPTMTLHVTFPRGDYLDFG